MRDAKSMLESIRQLDLHSQADKERVRSAIDTQLATQPPADAPAATAAATKWLTALAIAGVVGGAAIGLRALVSDEEKPQPQPALIEETVLPTEEVVEPPAKVPAPTPRTESLDMRTTPPPVVEASEPPTQPETLSATSNLAEETRLLRGAQLAMRDKDPKAALDFLNEHAERFPNGLLKEERLAAGVLALCALGDDTASEVAQRFLRSHPESVIADRVARTCSPGRSTTTDSD